MTASRMRRRKGARTFSTFSSARGVDVVWRENQAGCKGVCARVTTEDAHRTRGADVLSKQRELRRRPRRWARRAYRDSTARYGHRAAHDGQPRAGLLGGAIRRRSRPSRRRARTRCSAAASFLRSSTPTTTRSCIPTMSLRGSSECFRMRPAHGVDAGMLYVSDHGESLGEHGMYLHGMPYAICAGIASSRADDRLAIADAPRGPRYRSGLPHGQGGVNAPAMTIFFIPHSGSWMWRHAPTIRRSISLPRAEPGREMPTGLCSHNEIT